ncbi:DUF1573 domain-containing protein [Gemmata sp. JC673]|uniref:DUF1573 domain-containing protein n=1 Tax=Gemmata algarum TaxID=2975278 RepID=A0ABU5EUY9_9BACT|nr:DUF1573 domain-containing protein [Gemmata algarum]MDY3558270.1 DUF1573 domain-containing protein [Gemmata algarum]
MKSLIAAALTGAIVSLGSLGYWALARTSASPAPQSVEEPAPVAINPRTQADRRGQVYISEQIINYGRIGLHDTPSGSFFVINESDRTITLDQLVKSCGCTSAELGKREIPAGGRTEVKFSVRASGLRGPRVESIGVTFLNGEGEICGPIVAKVFFSPAGLLDVDPSDVVLTKDNPRATVTVRSEDPEALKKVLRAESRHPGITVDGSRLPVVTLELNDQMNESVLNTECSIYTTVIGEEFIRVGVRVRK